MTSYHLHNKTFLVTGASSGIGRQIAIHISEMGGTVIATGRSDSKLTDLLNSLKGLEHQLQIVDLLNDEELQGLIRNVPLLDGVVHCAGVVHPFPIKYVDKSKINETLRLNYETPLLLTGGLTRAKKINRGGSIVFLSSISGQHPHKGGALYASSKAAIEALSKTVALENYHLGIRSNCISPAMVKTEMFDRAEEKMSKDSMENHIKKYPLGVGKPEDVAHAAIFLLSPAARWITGTNMVLDGGFLLGA
ncbi:MAG: SDR family oxidoreductase [Nonlabens sp.]